MSALTGFFAGLPAEMRDPVLFAIPFFLLLLILEWTAARKLEKFDLAAGYRLTRRSPGHRRALT